MMGVSADFSYIIKLFFMAIEIDAFCNHSCNYILKKKVKVIYTGQAVSGGIIKPEVIQTVSGLGIGIFSCPWIGLFETYSHESQEYAGNLVT